MKAIDIKKQTPLGFRDVVKLTYHGVKFRLFRSLVVLSVVTVAIAFFMNTLSESLIRGKLRGLIEVLAEEERVAGKWASRLVSAPAQEDLLREAAAMEPGSPEARGAARLSGMSGEDMQAFLALAAASH